MACDQGLFAQKHTARLLARLSTALMTARASPLARVSNARREMLCIAPLRYSCVETEANAFAPVDDKAKTAHPRLTDM
jgi:hypothetical protein